MRQSFVQSLLGIRRYRSIARKCGPHRPISDRRHFDRRNSACCPVQIEVVRSNALILPIDHALANLDAIFCMAVFQRSQNRNHTSAVAHQSFTFASFEQEFFEKVRPQDEKIAFYLLRFYFAQPDIDEDVIDKVDFLATVAATGQSDPDASANKPRAR